MADKKISQLTNASTPLAGTEVLPIVQGGATVKVSVNNLTAGKAVSTGVVTSTSTTASQAVYTGWAPTGGANASNGSIDLGTAALSKGIVSYDATGAFPGALYLENTYDDNSASIRLRTRGADRFIVEGNGDLKSVSGNFVVGTAGKGIDFSANTGAAGETSALLNWYEEGTWTGTLTCGTSGTITLNNSFNTGSYTRVGRLVTVTGLFLVDSVAFPVGDLFLNGLPFAINNGGAYARTAAAVCAFDLAAGATTSIVGRGLAGESRIQLFKYAAGAISSLAGDVQSSSQFYVSMTYITV